MAGRVLVVPLLLSVAACSPFGGGAFACTDDSQCSGGTCAMGYCAFADSTCPSGERYGTLSGPMSNACVGATPLDAAEPDAFVALDVHPPLDATYCYGSGLAMPCFTAAPTTPVMLQEAIDTDTSSLCQSVIGNPPWCVIAGSDVTVSNTVGVTGSKPLVLVAVDKIDVTGTLSAASTRNGTEVIGASADFSGCDAGTPPTAASAAGGAGGSFGGDGGDGGDGLAMNTHGIHGASQIPSALRGGCAGQAGVTNGGTAGVAGHGGGVLALVANGSITVEGMVNASGEAGGGGLHPAAGGGGGGAGGLIVLDAPNVTAAGAIFTNGGGGGEASGNNGDGMDGHDPSATGAGPTTGGTSGGQGGAGGVGTSAALPGGSPGGHAGGGGGGSVGVIKLYRATSIAGGTVTPPPT